MAYKPPQQSVGKLMQQALWRRKNTVSKCKPTGDKSADEELWTQTLGEVDQGWIDGPYWDEHAVSDRLGTDDWMCTRRFPIVQGPKVRIIDDCLQSGLNSAYATYNKLYWARPVELLKVFEFGGGAGPGKKSFESFQF